MRYGNIRSENEMLYEHEQMERQHNICPICNRTIRRGQTTIHVHGIIYHSGCAP